MRIEDVGSGSFTWQTEKNQNDFRSIQEKMATGKKLNRASDGAAELAMAKQLEKMVTGHRRSGENLGDGMSALQIADGGSAQITQILQRQRELALQASNGTLNPEQKSALNDEFQALNEEVDRIAHSTRYGDHSLLDGSSPLSDGSGNIQSGPNGGNEDRIAFANVDLTTSGLGLGGRDLLTPQSASLSLSALDSALQGVSAARADQGSLYNRLLSAQETNHQQEIHTAEAQSRIEDLDMALGMTEQVSASLVNQTGNNLLGQMHTLSRSNIISLMQ